MGSRFKVVDCLNTVTPTDAAPLLSLYSLSELQLTGIQRFSLQWLGALRHVCCFACLNPKANGIILGNHLWQASECHGPFLPWKITECHPTYGTLSATLNFLGPVVGFKPCFPKTDKYIHLQHTFDCVGHCLVAGTLLADASRPGPFEGLKMNRWRAWSASKESVLFSGHHIYANNSWLVARAHASLNYFLTVTFSLRPWAVPVWLRQATDGYITVFCSFASQVFAASQCKFPSSL